MGFSRLDRKMALQKIGMTQREIAEACHTNITLVSHVLAGRRWMGPDGRKIMNYIAEKAGVEVEVFFPWSNRRKGDSRPFEDASGALEKAS